MTYINTHTQNAHMSVRSVPLRFTIYDAHD